MTQITLDLTPELGRRIDGWCKEFQEPPQALAVGLLEEYFEDSDTGARIAARVENDLSEAVEPPFQLREVIQAGDADIRDRLMLVDSLTGIIPSDITLDDAREERLSRI